MSTAELAGIPNRSLGDKVASLKSKRDEIIAELDFPVYRNLIQSLRPWFASME